MSRESATELVRTLGLRTGLVALVTGSAVLTSWLVGTTVSAIASDRMAPWILGRAAGITSYLLLVGLVVMGLLLSHPKRARIRRPSSATRIRMHVSLSVFTLVFTVLHVVVLATDKYAGVGWWGALVPMGASYRPVAVTLGVIGLYAGLAAGLTAALAGRVSRRLWWPIHKVAVASLILVWFHGVLAGIDTPVILSMYVLTGAGVLALAISRYLGTTHRSEADALADVRAEELRGAHRAPVAPGPGRRTRAGR